VSILSTNFTNGRELREQLKLGVEVEEWTDLSLIVGEAILTQGGSDVSSLE